VGNAFQALQTALTDIKQKIMGQNSHVKLKTGGGVGVGVKESTVTRE